MTLKIEPRKMTDRGGYLTMPLRENIPVPGGENWQLTNCPGCGRECWDRPLPDGVKAEMFGGRLCTMCALKAGMTG